MSGREPVAGARRGATRPGAVFLGLVALLATSATMTWTGFGSVRLDVFLFVVTGWVVSLCLHEYAHALLAFRAGDASIAERGYLTLNPLRYAHPVLSLVLPVAFLLLGGIGLPGGAVWLDRNAVPDRRARSLISLAGPGTNALLASVVAVPFLAGADVSGHRQFWAALAFLGFLQITATLLNLMPIPGVDGGNVVEPWLNPQWRHGFALMAPYGMLLLFALLYSPRLNAVFFTGVDTLGTLLGLPEGLVSDGYRLFRFWA